MVCTAYVEKPFSMSLVPDSDGFWVMGEELYRQEWRLKPASETDSERMLAAALDYGFDYARKELYGPERIDVEMMRSGEDYSMRVSLKTL